MERTDVVKAIGELAGEVLDADPSSVTEETTFAEDLGADSLELIELVSELEERFDVSVPEDELEGVNTVGDAASLVMAKIGASA